MGNFNPGRMLQPAPPQREPNFRFNSHQPIYSNQGYQRSNTAIDHSNQWMDNINQGYDHSNQGYDHSNQGFDHSNPGYDHSNQGIDHSNQDHGPSNDPQEALNNLIHEQRKLISEIDQAIDRSKAVNLPGSLVDQNQNQIINAGEWGKMNGKCFVNRCFQFFFNMS